MFAVAGLEGLPLLGVMEVRCWKRRGSTIRQLQIRPQAISAILWESFSAEQVCYLEFGEEVTHAQRAVCCFTYNQSSVLTRWTWSTRLTMLAMLYDIISATA